MMVKLLVPFLGLLAVAWGETTSVSSCLIQGNDTHLPINTYVLGCPTPPCSFAQHTDVVVQIVFRSRSLITTQSVDHLRITYLWIVRGTPKHVPNTFGTCSRIATRRITSMRTEAWAYILGPIGVNYDLGDEANTCNFFTNTYCPLQENEVVLYTLRMHIESWMPAGTSVTVEFLIRDTSNNGVLTCVRIPVRVLAGLRANETTLIEHKTSETE